MKQKRTTVVMWLFTMLLMMSPILQTQAFAVDTTTEAMFKESTEGMGRDEQTPYLNRFKTLNLQLTAETITVEVGKTYEIEVLPNELAKLLGWSIKEVKVNGQVAEVCEIDKSNLKFTIKGMKKGKATIEVYLVNSQDGSVKTQRLKCMVTVEKYTNSVSESTYEPNFEDEAGSNENQGDQGGDDDNKGNQGGDDDNKGDQGGDDDNKGDQGGDDDNKGDQGGDDDNKGDQGDDDNDTKLKPMDTSKLAFDVNTLSMVYDGKSHLPTIIGVPEGAEIVWRSEAKTNAGTYEVIAGFNVPDGYEPIPDMSTNFEIEKAEVSTRIGYDEGKIIVAFDGIMPEDTISDTFKSFVNGEKFNEQYQITKPGRYVATTEINVDAEKVENYTGLESLEKSFLIKRENEWYHVSGELVQEGETVTFKVYISDINVMQGDEFAFFTLGFNVDFDQSVLKPQYSNVEDEYSQIYGDTWNGYYTSGADGLHDAVINYDGEPLYEKSLVCEIVYDVLKDENGLLKSTEDLQFNIINPTLVSEVFIGDDYDEVENLFEYTTDLVTVILNPTENAPKEEIIYIDNDLIQDAVYQGDEEDEEEKAYHVGELQKYIDNGFQIVIASEGESEIEMQSELEPEIAGNDEGEEKPASELEAKPESKVESEPKSEANTEFATEG